MTVRTLNLRTERLDLRRFSVDDAPVCFRNWMSDPEVARFATWSAHRDVAETESVISGWVREYDLGTMDWCICLRGGEFAQVVLHAPVVFPVADDCGDREHCLIALIANGF